MTAQSRPVKGRPVRASTVAVDRRGGSDGVWETIKFGDVTITARRPSDDAIRRSAETGWAGLARALPKLVRPGVRIYPKKDVPLYWCDSDDPHVFIRKLNGKIQRGVFEDGQFKATD
jgi:hypothetical protein